MIYQAAKCCACNLAGMTRWVGKVEDRSEKITGLSSLTATTVLG